MMNGSSLISAGSSGAERTTNLTEEPEENLVGFKVNAKTLVSQAANGRARALRHQGLFNSAGDHLNWGRHNQNRDPSVGGWPGEEENRGVTGGKAKASSSY